MPLVSCLIPSYNHAAHVGCAIESALAQTLEDAEILVQDDASTDGSAEVLARFERVPRVELERHRENQGVSATFNALAARARGTYLAYLPSDDLWLPDHLARGVEALEAAPAAAFSWGKADLMGPAGEPLSGSNPWDDHAPPDLFTRLVMGGTNPIPFQTTLIRRSAFEDVRGFDPDIVGIQDYDLWLRLAARRSSVFIPHVVGKVRFHEGQVSHRTEDTSLRFHVERVQMLEKALRDDRRAIESRGLAPAFQSRLADLHARLSRRYRHAGDTMKADRHLFRSLELRPFQPSLWPRALRSLMKL